MTRPRILAIDDEAIWRCTLPRVLRELGDVVAVAGVDDALTELEAGCVDVVICDHNLGDDKGRNGLWLLQWCKRNVPQLPFVLHTSDRDAVDKAWRAGGAFCVLKGRVDAIRRVVVETTRLAHTPPAKREAPDHAAAGHLLQLEAEPQRGTPETRASFARDLPALRALQRKAHDALDHRSDVWAMAALDAIDAAVETREGLARLQDAWGTDSLGCDRDPGVAEIERRIAEQGAEQATRTCLLDEHMKAAAAAELRALWAFDAEVNELFDKVMEALARRIAEAALMAGADGGRRCGTTDGRRMRMSFEKLFADARAFDRLPKSYQAAAKAANILQMCGYGCIDGDAEWAWERPDGATRLSFNFRDLAELARGGLSPQDIARSILSAEDRG